MNVYVNVLNTAAWRRRYTGHKPVPLRLDTILLDRLDRAVLAAR